MTATTPATTTTTQPRATLGSAPCSAGVDRLRGTLAEKRQAANQLLEQNLASWIQLSCVNDFIPTLQAACNRVFESFEILHGRKKAYPFPAQWKSGELLEWHLFQRNSQAFIEIEASFEVWFDSNMFKRTHQERGKPWPSGRGGRARTAKQSYPPYVVHSKRIAP